jgi:hypothetical protein
MPVIPPIPVQPYDTVNELLTAVGVRVNDEVTTLLPISGKLLDNTQPFTQKTVNTAWRNAQEVLADKGYSRLIDETIIYSLPSVASNDPASQVKLDWNGYFDGANFFPQPRLPQGFGHPLKIWERWSNQNAQFCNEPMEKILDGIPAWAKTTANRYWEWRNDAIYMPGSQMTEDLRIRHTIFLDDFIDLGTTPWFMAPIPIVRCVDGLSWFVIAELAGSRGLVDMEAVMREKGERALCRVFNLDVKADQRVNVRRRARGACRNNWY